MHTEPVHAPDLSQRSTARLVRDVGEQLARLVRTEVRLAQIELRSKGKQAGMGAALISAGGVLGLLGGAMLIATVVLALDIVLPAWLAALIVAVALLAIAGVAALVGRSRLKRSSGALPESLESIKQDYRDLGKALKR
ncbi:phage holin family protein [Saccharopolyspora sp. NPDC050642]|uniref:phage holin family protein n=1 Tax=Saccharopolyspora sp. NPDC050642 TaxID=3157099 RepID=UPI0033F6A88B